MIFDSKTLLALKTTDVLRYIRDPNNYVKTTMKKHQVLAGVMKGGRYTDYNIATTHGFSESQRHYTVDQYFCVWHTNTYSYAVSPAVITHCCEHTDGTPIEKSEFIKISDGSYYLSPTVLTWNETSREYFVLFAPCRDVNEGPNPQAFGDYRCLSAIVAPCVYDEPDMTHLCWYSLATFMAMFNLVPFKKFFASLDTKIAPAKAPDMDIVSKRNFVLAETVQSFSASGKSDTYLSEFRTMGHKAIVTRLLAEVKKPKEKRDIALINTAVPLACGETWTIGNNVPYLSFSSLTAASMYSIATSNEVANINGKDVKLHNISVKVGFDLRGDNIIYTVNNGICNIFTQVGSAEELVRLVQLMGASDGKDGKLLLGNRFVTGRLIRAHITGAPGLLRVLTFLKSTPFLHYNTGAHFQTENYIYRYELSSIVQAGFDTQYSAFYAYARAMSGTRAEVLARNSVHEHYPMIMSHLKNCLKGALSMFLQVNTKADNTNGLAFRNYKFEEKGSGYYCTFEYKPIGHTVMLVEFKCDDLINIPELYVNNKRINVNPSCYPLSPEIQYAIIGTSNDLMFLSYANGCRLPIYLLKTFLEKSKLLIKTSNS